MKIVAIAGSPRKGGNSDILLGRIIAGAQESHAKDVQVDKFYLHDMDIKPCSACDACRRSSDDPCVLEDDMQVIHAKLRECDAFVVGTPIYWFAPSAQTKIFMDRWYALGGPEGHRLKGKRAVVAMTYADPDPLSSGVTNAYRIFQDALNWAEVELLGVVHGAAWEKGEIEKKAEVVKEAFDLGRKL